MDTDTTSRDEGGEDEGPKRTRENFSQRIRAQKRIGLPTAKPIHRQREWFTEERQEQFLLAYLEEGAQLHACAATGIPRSTVGWHLKNNPEFAAKYAEAQDTLRSLRTVDMEDQAFEDGYFGREYVKYRDGEVVEEGTRPVPPVMLAWLSSNLPRVYNLQRGSGKIAEGDQRTAADLAALLRTAADAMTADRSAPEETEAATASTDEHTE